MRISDWSSDVCSSDLFSIMSGDDRCQEAANDAFRPVAKALQTKIEAAQRDGRIDADQHPVALGAVLNLMIDVAGMAGPALNKYWNAADSSELFAAVAYVFDRAPGVDTEHTCAPLLFVRHGTARDRNS